MRSREDIISDMDARILVEIIKFYHSLDDEDKSILQECEGDEWYELSMDDKVRVLSIVAENTETDFLPVDPLCEALTALVTLAHIEYERENEDDYID